MRSATSSDTRVLSRARVAVATLFFLNGAIYANLVPRLPEIKASLDLSNASFGLAIAAMPVGALASGLLAPVLIRRWGSGRVAALGMASIAIAVGLVPFAGSLMALAATMLAIGASDAIADVGQNTHGFRVQRQFGRSLMNGFHALWSVGAVTGGLLGAAAAGANLPLATHLGIATITFVAIALAALPRLLHGPDPSVGDRQVAMDDGRTPTRRVPAGTVLLLAVLGLLAACEAFIQDAASSWGALYLSTDLGTGAALAGAAFVAMQVAMTGGRLVGDRLVDRYGQRRVARLGGLVAASGMTVALVYPTVATTIIGFALAGLGIATLYPAIMLTADELPGLRPAVGIAVVSWLLRIGFLLSPVVVGLIADQSGLRVALSTMVVAGIGVVVMGRVLVDRGNEVSDRAG
jgi:MFS family permease